MKALLARASVQAMAAILMVGAVGITAELGTPIASAAPAKGAQKVRLTPQNRDCNGDPVAPILPNPSDHGFANIHPTGSGTLIANVVLKGGTPNTTYNIRLIQTFNGTAIPGECVFLDSDGTLVTDEFGDGSANIQESLLPSANDAFVVLNNLAAPTTDFFTTEEVEF
ncbi:hypothetical protein SAMN02745121_05919 [Nannocystis exedens]|uniref:Uncharacterized protein n=1 Tax=Nannocystis exedens TaxID=54 RepID=A0A1I2E8H5_9BACT|nr:hypothetical protein [Nannocystis exedens]PCC74902.1 hypothetical protein NAEX_08002 [Nannocystis exedens]SFE89007.1 hypothetical protein SAMN02745121_05919 [Nannocystis exedens]